jgi:vancomycin permeability regulator SanA
LADAVIVLANLMDAKGVLNDESVMRLKAGCECYESRSAGFMVTSGWAYRNDSDICIGSAMARTLVREFGVPDEHIKVDLSARDTVGDALFTKMNVVVPNGWRSIVVVTSDYHRERAKEIFTFIYGVGYEIEVIGIKTSPTAQQLANEVSSLAAFRDTFKSVQSGDTLSIFKKLTDSHPYYNGMIFPKFR